ncbi:MAG: thiamine diphosphokinase [Mediterranea massiliensis]|nr:thiamine diphosphokinase [Mediterranea massiliensis]
MKIEAVVLANGEYPTHPTPLQVLAKAPYVVCCDGGADEYIAHGHRPDLIVGDGDSLSDINRRLYADLLLCIDDQETNDQTKAIGHLRQLGKRSIAIVGATGKREDHTIGNISLLMEYMRMGLKVRMFTDHGMFIPCSNTCQFDCRPGQQVSIFNFTARNFRSEGLRYPIYDFTTWWQGTLNCTIADTFSIDAEGDFLLFITY